MGYASSIKLKGDAVPVQGHQQVFSFHFRCVSHAYSVLDPGPQDLFSEFPIGISASHGR